MTSMRPTIRPVIRSLLRAWFTKLIARILRQLAQYIAFTLYWISPCLVSSLEAQEFPSGWLPEAIDPQKPGSIILHGGGLIEPDILAEFVRLSGGEEARIVVIPSGIFVQGQHDDGTEFEESREDFEERFRPFWSGWIEMKRRGSIESLAFLYTDNRTDCDQAEFVDAIRHATGILIPAAFQGKLAWRFTHRYPDGWDDRSDSLFQRSLRELVARGGVVFAHGGGCSAMADIMIMGGESVEERPMQAEIQPGLGLLRGTIIDQNFDAVHGRLERLTNLLKDTPRLNSVSRWPATGRQTWGIGIEQQRADHSTNEASRHRSKAGSRFSQRQWRSNHLVESIDEPVTADDLSFYSLGFDRHGSTKWTT